MLGTFLYHIFGLSGTGPLNAFYQGIGGDLSELGIFIAMAALIRKHQCHQKRCWRFGHYKQDDIGTLKCRKHLGKERELPMVNPNAPVCDRRYVAASRILLVIGTVLFVFAALTSGGASILSAPMWAWGFGAFAAWCLAGAV
jgi:hypothetical protein